MFSIDFYEKHALLRIILISYTKRLQIITSFSDRKFIESLIISPPAIYFKTTMMTMKQIQSAILIIDSRRIFPIRLCTTTAATGGTTD